MPRDGLGQYSPPPGTNGITNFTIESSKYNGFVADITADQNNPRPIVAGGTAATTVDGALDNLSAEKFKQVDTDWNTTVWRAGSFYAATTATGTAPVTGHAFAGIAYYANATDFVCEATDVTDPANPAQYIRIMSAGVWGSWIVTGGGANSGEFIFDSTLTFPPAAGQVRLNNATQNAATEVFISHLNTFGSDLTGIIATSIVAGNDLLIQDKDEPGKYKIFSLLANPVLSGGDFRATVTFKSGGTNIVSAQHVLVSASAAIAVAKKNYILNGAMQISQEFSTATAINNTYPVDAFSMQFANSGTQTAQQVAGYSPAGSPYRLRVNASVSDVSVGAGDYFMIRQNIEGFRVADLMSGTASAKTITIKFGVKAPAGTYCVCVRNGIQNRSYVAEYVIASGEANTDVVKSVTLRLDVAGTWETGSNTGIGIDWTLMAGTTGQTTANSWQAGNYYGTSSQFNFMGTGGNIFELFDVGMYEGTAAPPFTVPDYAAELAACRRYWFATKAMWGVAYSANAVAVTMLHYGMRTSPTISQSAPLTITDVFSTNPVQSSAHIFSSANTPDSGQYNFDNFTGLTSGRWYMNFASTPEIKFNARL